MFRTENLTYEQIAKVIVHSLLCPEITQQEIIGGVRSLNSLPEVIEARYTRCGVTATTTILDAFKKQKETG
jgi:deoxyribose-phosphate aldolase